MLEPEVLVMVNTLRLTLTWREIAVELNRRGVVCKTGCAWTMANVRRHAKGTTDLPQRLIKRAAINALKNRPCMDCGGTFAPCQMDFDHRDGETKRHNVSSASCTLARALEEIKKCDLVCANCHRLRTYRRSKACQANVCDA